MGPIPRRCFERTARRRVSGRVHATVDDPQTLPREVKDAYLSLDEKLGLGQAGEGAAPGDDRPEFDPEDVFQAARREEDEASFGGFSIGDLLAPLRVLSFWKMKDRARKFGESGANKLLLAMYQAAAGKDLNVHLMGHSFGCIVVSAMLAGAPKLPDSGLKVKLMVLVQGA